MKFEQYKNNIPKEKYDVIYEILKNNTKKRNPNFEDSKEIYNTWVNTILTTKDYNIILCIKDNIITGFIAYSYINEKLYICEIQIKEEYQGKCGILKKLLKEFIKNIPNTTIYSTISKNNIKSQEVFTHIGFINTENNVYTITCEKLKEWINK